MSKLFNPYELGCDFSTKNRVDGWDPDMNCPNPHLLITGQSGGGKTTLLKDIINYLGNKRNKIVFVLDIHNGMDVENENYIKYSARNTNVGINPLSLIMILLMADQRLEQVFWFHCLKNILCQMQGQFNKTY